MDAAMTADAPTDWLGLPAQLGIGLWPHSKKWTGRALSGNTEPQGVAHSSAVEAVVSHSPCPIRSRARL